MGGLIGGPFINRLTVPYVRLFSVITLFSVIIGVGRGHKLIKNERKLIEKHKKVVRARPPPDPRPDPTGISTQN